MKKSLLNLLNQSERLNLLLSMRRALPVVKKSLLNLLNQSERLNLLQLMRRALQKIPVMKKNITFSNIITYITYR